jgi:opacity protein-like surface antigen
MKTISKLCLIAASLATLGTSAAFADNQQLVMRITRERFDEQRQQKAGAIAVYSDRQGLDQWGATNQAGMHFEFRLVGGKYTGLYVPGDK